MTPVDDHQRPPTRWTRRAILRKGARVGLGLPFAASFLDACGGSSKSSGAKNLAFWWWAESDAPGADAWLTRTAAKYKQETGVSVTRVTQATDSLSAAFSAAARARSGPDLASQWAGAYVLTQTLGGAITPIADLLPASELSHWLNLWENQYNGK